jgi:hypothetical protein
MGPKLPPLNLVRRIRVVPIALPNIPRTATASRMARLGVARRRAGACRSSRGGVSIHRTSRSLLGDEGVKGRLATRG